MTINPEVPYLDGKGELATPTVLAQIDARTKATMRADLPALAEELKIGGVDGSVPIFPTLAEAEAWEAANPGKTALTLEATTPDVSAPVWPAGVAMQVSYTDTEATVTLSQLAGDDRGVETYEVSVDAGATWRSTATGDVVFDASARTLKVTGLSRSTAYPAPRVRAKDRAGNASIAVVGASGFTTDAAPPVAYQQAALAHDPLYFFPLGAEDRRLNMGSLGTNIGDVLSTMGTPAGAPLGGYPDSLALSSEGGQAQQFVLTGAEMRKTPEAWSVAFLIRIKGYELIKDGTRSGRFAVASLPGGNLDFGTASNDPSFKLTLVGTPILTGLQPEGTLNNDYLISVESDATNGLRAYVNGALHSTAAHTPWPQAGRWGPGVEASGFQLLGASASIETRGYLLHNKALGEAAHLELAKKAGVA